MPRYDKTGPDGKGPRTGRGEGDCPPDKKNQRPRNPGALRRAGRGLRNRFFPADQKK